MATVSAHVRFLVVAIVATMMVLGGADAATAAGGHPIGGPVHGDDLADEYVGTGGLILPGSVDASVRREVSSCLGCEWRVTSPCARSDLGAPLDRACAGVVRGCPGGSLRRTWFRAADGPWRETGLVCLRQGGLLTVRDARAAVLERLSRAVPALRPAAAPPRGVLPQLPTYFDTGMPRGEQVFTFMVAGHALAVHAQPRWSWTFGDGASMRTDDPGGSFPWGTVTHVYRVAGTFEVVCATMWTAEFWSDGLGPFPVPEGIRQEAAFPVVVGEGRAALVPGDRPPDIRPDVRGTMAHRPARPS
ncbi:MAG: hypothetical protein GC156_10235 [Actinomycetales bacterium]|nr:hypothetical protein [Actinomycetales bacterium]